MHISWVYTVGTRIPLDEPCVTHEICMSPTGYNCYPRDIPRSNPLGNMHISWVTCISRGWRAYLVDDMHISWVYTVGTRIPLGEPCVTHNICMSPTRYNCNPRDIPLSNPLGNTNIPWVTCISRGWHAYLVGIYRGYEDLPHLQRMSSSLGN